MALWADISAALTKRKPVTIEIEGLGPVSFHALHTGILFRFKHLGEDAAKAFSVLFGKRDTDTGVEDREITDAEGGRIREIKRSAAAPGVIAQREQSRERVLGQLASQLTSDATKELLGLTLISSLRLEDVDDPITYVDELPVDVLPKLLEGVFQANRGVLAPFEKRAKEALAHLTERLRQDDLQAPSDEPAEVDEAPEVSTD